MTGCNHICYVNCGLSGDDCHCYRVSMSPSGSLLSSIPAETIAATEALASIVAQAQARGRIAGLNEAAEIADTLYYPDETKRSAGIRDAILARAAEIEKGECDE